MKQIDTCKSCTKRKYDSQQGILCSLTDAKPTFENTCPDFQQDEKILNKEIEISQHTLPNQKSAKWAMWIMWALIAAQLLAVLSHYLNYNLLVAISKGESLTTQAAEANDLRHTMVLLLYYLLLIGSVVSFAIWFYRAHLNYHTRSKVCTFSKSWAFWGWVVPIASLFIPYKIMSEMYEDIKQNLIEKSKELTSTNMSLLIGWWWAMWIIFNFVTSIFSKIFNDEESIQGMMDTSIVEMISGLIMIPAAILAFKLIKEYSQMELQLDESRKDLIKEV
jgi:magnesium-transporting ATPase (P-type)